MPRHIPQDHNYRTDCPAAIKAKITELENQAIGYAYSRPSTKAEYSAARAAPQAARYNLERTILSHIKAAVAEAMKERAKQDSAGNTAGALSGDR